jgi:capsular exopolysaccharide synthesis family protein
MQDHIAPAAFPPPAQASASASSNFITHHDVIRFVKRYYATIALTTLAGVVLALAYVLTATPLYTARTQIIIDPSLPQALRENGSGSLFAIDNAQVESQLEVLRSEKIANAVIDALQLETDPQFNADGGPSLWGRFMALFSDDTGQVDPFILRRATLYRLQAGLSVRRIGLSYAIDIQFRSQSPELSAKIANATAQAYVDEQIAARAQAARQGGQWLEQRIDQLRQQMNKAALEAQKFRARRDYRLTPRNGSNGSADRASTAEDRQAAAASRQNTMEELESTAQTYRRIYESYLMAYTEAVQKQSYPITNARVITPATRPLAKSHPRSKLILAFGGLMGALAGLAIAFFRHSTDRSVWGARQIREELGLECLANIPVLIDRTVPSVFSTAGLRETATGVMDQAARFRQLVERVAKLIPPKLGGRGGGKDKCAPQRKAYSLAASLPRTEAEAALDAVISMPFSGFSHGIKTLKSSISLAGRARRARTICLTSALPSEGKTTVTANLATLFAMSDVRTLLIDGDLRNAKLSHMLAPNSKLGLVDAISEAKPVEDCIMHVNEAGLDFLPATDGLQDATYSDEIFGSKKARDLIARLQDSYDIILVEMPPMTASLDGLTVSAMTDCTVLVAEWGKTPMPVLSEAVRLLRRARVEILGVALNKVDASAMSYGDVVATYAYASRPSTPLTTLPRPVRLSRRQGAQKEAS